MRVLFTFLIVQIIFAFHSDAQPPALIPYQAIARDAAGNAVLNQNIGLRFSIHDQTITGTVVWQEAQIVLSNPLGVVVTSLGSVSDLSSVNWANGDKFLQVEMDITGGTNYSDMGTQQMMSVPYALYAGSSSSISSTNGNGLFTHWIGELFGGGIICHLWKDQNGVEHGLIASLVDLGFDENTPPFGVKWQDDNSTSSVQIDMNHPYIGNEFDGQENTIFLSQQNNLLPDNPAILCANFENEGLNDWYLPAPMELELIWQSIHTVNSVLRNIPTADIIGCSQLIASTNMEGFSSASAYALKNQYWSSAVISSGNYFYYRTMTIGSSASTDSSTQIATLNYPYNVRAIRKF